jgi:predicted  nucleic acid-binding Zn-ribbon protein
MGTDARLLDLQTLDLRIERLSVRVRSLEAGDDLTRARSAADAAERALGELKLQLDVLDRDGSKLEHEIDSLQQKMAAERQRMFDGSVANAKELEAMGREIENLQRRVGDREDELLVILEARDGLEGRAKEAAAETDELRTEVEQVAAASGDELATVTAELQDLQAERSALAARLDPELLELYEELRAHKKGVGVAALVDGVCQGCHEALSSVELDHVKHDPGVPRCEHCRRILVV